MSRKNPFFVQSLKNKLPQKQQFTPVLHRKRHKQLNFIRAAACVLMVRETGLEPACCCQHTDLNRTRLPIPPFQHSWWMGVDSNHRSL